MACISQDREADKPAGFTAHNFGLRIDADQLVELAEFRVTAS